MPSSKQPEPQPEPQPEAEIRSAVYVGPSGSITLADGSGPFHPGRRVAISRHDQLILARDGHVFNDVLDNTDPALLVEPEPDPGLVPEPAPEPVNALFPPAAPGANAVIAVTPPLPANTEGSEPESSPSEEPAPAVEAEPTPKPAEGEERK